MNNGFEGMAATALRTVALLLAIAIGARLVYELLVPLIPVLVPLVILSGIGSAILHRRGRRW
ncbi:hypothetical protein ACWC4E_33870 [Streptomyces sp. NPDC001273]|uniref:hypothetical protein n=1 Tax=unclassified Streptomyces TaxID=2593676 RepID=UPI0033C57AF1